MTDLEGVTPITKEEREQVIAMSRVARHGDWFTGPVDIVARYEARLSELEAEVEGLSDG